MTRHDQGHTERHRQKNGVSHARQALPSLENIKDDIDLLQDHVLGLAQEIRSAGAVKANDAVDYLNKRMDEVKVSGEKTLSKIERRVQAKPRQSITIAFAVGALASFLLSRRS